MQSLTSHWQRASGSFASRGATSASEVNMELPDMVTPRLNTKTALGQALVSMFKSGNKEPPISALTHILQDYLESTDDEAR
jgi:hypothetical protein